MDPQIENDLGEANNVLLIAPQGAETADDVCSSLLNPDESGDRSVVNVTLTQSLAERLQFLETHVGSEFPTVTTVIAVGESARSGDRTSLDLGIGAGRDAVDFRIAVRPIADPTDTLSLGLEMIECLSRRTAEGYRVVGCVHTLSDLLRQAGYGRTIELLGSLLERTARLDATVHYHLDAESHDDDVVDLLRPLFDAVIEIGPDGDRQIERNESTRDWDAVLDGRPEVTIREATPSHDAVLDLLSNHRRREVLYYLRTCEPAESVPVDALVDRLLDVERREGAPDRADLRERIAVALRHRHLPRLADAGLVDWESDAVVRRPWGTPLKLWIEQAMFIDERFERNCREQ